MNNILQFIFAHKWMMYQPALHALIDVVCKVTDNPEALARAFHGTNFEHYLTEDNIPKHHAFLSNADYPRLENTFSAYQVGDVAIIPVIGGIFPRASSVPMSYGANVKVDRFTHDFNTALNNDSIKTIINVYDSPGGEVTGVSETAQALFAARGQKKVISYVYGMAASAGYWWASSGSEVVASNTAEVGSIGVVASFLDYSEFDAKKGIKRHEVVSNLSPNKRPNLNTDEGRAQIQKTVDDLAFIFVETVAKHRGAKFEEVMENYGQGKMFVAKEALKNGMIDRISTLDALIQEVKSSTNNPFTGGTYMNLAELQAKDPEGYKKLMDEAQEKVAADTKLKQEADAKAKAEADEKAKKAAEKEAAEKEEQAKKESQAGLNKEQQKLSSALADVGTKSSGDKGDTVTAEQKSFVDAAAKAMNAARHL